MKKIPITIGIIGHRDAILIDEHYKALESILDSLNILYPASPITLISQLAEGVDSKIAEHFLKLKENSNRTYQLVVPLPFHLSKYRDRFPKDKLQKFDDLIDKSDNYFELEHDDQTSLNELYRRGGQFVADNSLILIAIWDLVDNRKVGGTADIVKYKRCEILTDDSFSTNVFEPTGSLISIPCSRSSSTNSKSVEIENNYLDKLLKDDSLQKALSTIEEYNKETWDEKKLLISQQFLYPKTTKLSASMNKLKHYYSMMDVMASDNQIAYKWTLKTLFVLALIVITIYQTYAQLGLHQNIFIAIIALLGLMFGVFSFSGKWRNHIRYLENRILAEALRIQFFWNLSGLREPVSKHILRVYRSEFKWIKHLLNTIYGLSYETVPKDNLENIKSVKKHWMDEQNKYFRKKLNDYIIQKSQFDRISHAFLSLAIIILGLTFVLNFLHVDESVLKTLIILDTILFGFFGLTKGYYGKRGFEQISNQHALMSKIYRLADERIEIILESDLSSQKKFHELQTLFLKIGKEALNENGYWYSIFKDKEPEIEGFAV